MKTSEIATLLEGTLIGDPEIVINAAAGIEQAGAGDITFLLKGRYLNTLTSSTASAVVTKERLDLEICQIIVSDPLVAMAVFLAHFYKPPAIPEGIEPTAVLGSRVTLGSGVTVMANVTVSADVSLGNDVKIFPGVFIGRRCRIDAGTMIHPNVSIYDGVEIGRNVTVHAGTVIGSDGFGYHLLSSGKRLKIPQTGGVTIEDNVEIGANVCIDRGTISNTIIKNGTKIDNLVQIAHNVIVGENTVIAGQSGIAGSSVIGDGVMMGGNAGVSDHVEIESGTMLAANAGVSGNLRRGVYSGSPAIEHRKWIKAQAAFPRLPDLIKTVRELSRRLSELEGN